MIDKEIVKKIYSTYGKYGVEEKTIMGMMETGIIFGGLSPEIVVYNMCSQLTEEYVHDNSIDPFRKTAEILDITTDELLALVI